VPSTGSSAVLTNTDKQKDVFEEVREVFVQSIDPKRRHLFSNCASAEQLLSDARSWDLVKKNRIRGAVFICDIGKFANSVKPYFDVIGMIAQSHPEFAAIAWGAIRFVLQVSLTLQDGFFVVKFGFTYLFPACKQLLHLF
jgi:hypothetical protein